MSKTWRNWSVAALLATLVPAGLWAQAQTSGRINGRVLDQDGNPLPGAQVSANAPALNLERETVSGANGEFLFALLPIGGYTVTVSLEGFQPEVLSLQLGLGQIVPLEVTLRPGDTLGETIEVTGSISALETTTGGANISYEKQVEQLPVLARDPESVIATMAPSVSSGSRGTQSAGTYNIAGAPSFDTTVLLDGAEISDPYFGSAPDLFLEDAIAEVQLLTTGVSARYGRFQGGVINAVTKSGSNDFAGVLRLELDKESWNGATPFGEEQSDDLGRTYQGTIGGPVLRDRLWFFGGYRKIPETAVSDVTLVTGENFTQSTNQTRWQFKLTAALGPSHLLEASTTEFEQTTDNYGGLLPADDLALGRRSDPRTTYTASYQGVFGASTFAELQWTLKDVDVQSGATNTERDPFYDLNNAWVYNNHWWDVTDPSVRDNETWGASVTHVVTTERFGAHSLEGGIQWVESNTGGENRQSATGYNLLAFNLDDDFSAGVAAGSPRFNLRTGEAIRWVALPLGGEQTLDNRAAFLQDTIDIGNFRFDLGVRYDEYEGSGPLPQFNIGFEGFAPRLGVTYALRPELQLQATFGRYISRFNDNVASNATGVGSAPRIEQLYVGPSLEGATGDEVQAALRNDAFWGLVTDYVQPAAETTLLGRDIEAPYADEITLGVRGAFPDNKGTYVLTYVDRSYERLLDDFVGGACDYGIDFGRACPAGNTTTVLLDGEPFTTVDTTVWANNPRARRNYEAMTAVLDLRPVERLSLGANYTYATTKTNYEGEGRNTPSSGSVFGNYERAIDLSLAAPYGYADDDIRHRLNVYGTYLFDFERFGRFAVGSLLRYRSGMPWSKTATVARASVEDYLTETGAYTAFFGRGTERFDDWWSFDLSLRYDIAVWRDVRPYVKLGVVNVLGNDAVIEYQTSGRAVADAQGNLSWEPIGSCGLGDAPSRSCTGFGRIRSDLDYQAPRTYLLTVAIEF
jgi:hypothetical protein